MATDKLSSQLKRATAFDETGSQTAGIRQLKCGALNSHAFAFHDGAKWQHIQLQPILEALGRLADAAEDVSAHSETCDWECENNHPCAEYRTKKALAEVREKLNA